MNLDNKMINYDTIGQNYCVYRQADARLLDAINEYLPDATHAPTILELGAGTGNYSVGLADQGYSILALEPSKIMRDQAKTHPNVQWIPATLNAYSQQEEAVDAIVAIMVIHHLKPLKDAITHCFNLCPKGPIIFFIWDPHCADILWMADYFPQVWNQALLNMPSVEDVCEVVQQQWESNVEIKPFLVPADYKDRFVPANWSRPEDYCDINYLRSTSGFALTDQTLLSKQIEKLKRDLENGSWHKRYGHLLKLEACDVGCRFVCISPVTT